MKLVEAEMERRRAIRFPVRLPVRYSMKEAHAAHGAGEILNMSSNGVLLTTESHLEPLKTVLLVISWPALLDGEIPLNLVASGRVVRSWDGKPPSASRNTNSAPAAGRRSPGCSHEAYSAASAFRSRFRIMR